MGMNHIARLMIETWLRPSGETSRMMELRSSEAGGFRHRHKQYKSRILA